MLAYVELIQRKEKELKCDVLTHQKWSVNDLSPDSSLTLRRSGAGYIDGILSSRCFSCMMHASSVDLSPSRDVGFIKHIWDGFGLHRTHVLIGNNISVFPRHCKYTGNDNFLANPMLLGGSPCCTVQADPY